uniref:Uncharacterized protein n=1 Tax=Magnaporthe oryzae polymycovirus 2 TaxID=2838331 RepID=A0A8E6Z6H5_9VIRU|nr:hypothetical protein [Magnaporthe oryzae polymycovirus 2]
MADLARLRAALSESGSPILPLSGIIHHMAPTPTTITLLDADSVMAILNWLVSAPSAFYGPFLTSSGLTVSDVSSLVASVTPSDAASIASLVNAMATHDGEWDRSVRNDTSRRVAQHSSGAGRVSSQSAVEFAALDLISSCGFEGLAGAVSAFGDVRLSYQCKVSTIAHQFARSRHAVFARIKLKGDNVRIVVTPWCLSRVNALAVAAVMTADLKRAAVADRTMRRARTAVSYASRLSLQAVRDVLAAATSLLTRCSYDSTRMAFVNPATGAVVQDTASRQMSVAIAFAHVFTRGSTDAVMTLADARAATLDRYISSAPPQVADYFGDAHSPLDALALFSRALGATRRLRDVTEEGSRRNKGAMLGYAARMRTKGDRNTVACINRIEEVVSALKARGCDHSRLLLVVEWGGTINHAAILAAAAAAGIDIALDVAASGIDLPGHDVLSDDQDNLHRYQLYLSSAQSRKLPRVPVAEYLEGEPLHSRLRKLLATFDGSLPQHQVAFVAGGVQHALSTPVSINVDAVSRHAALLDVSADYGIVASCAEVLLPPVCAHGIEADPGTFLDNGTFVDTECAQCEEHHRAVAAVADLVSREDTRLVKPRAIHGHNGYFSVETIYGQVVSGDTLRTLDAAISLSHARNVNFGDDDDPGLGYDEYDSHAFATLLRTTVSEVHRALSGGDVSKVPKDDADRIAESVQGS